MLTAKFSPVQGRDYIPPPSNITNNFYTAYE
jgi:hypothetical protein